MTYTNGLPARLSSPQQSCNPDNVRRRPRDVFDHKISNVVLVVILTLVPSSLGTHKYK